MLPLLPSSGLLLPPSVLLLLPPSYELLPQPSVLLPLLLYVELPPQPSGVPSLLVFVLLLLYALSLLLLSDAPLLLLSGVLPHTLLLFVVPLQPAQLLSLTALLPVSWQLHISFHLRHPKTQCHTYS